MEKEDLERDLEKAEKGVVVTIINQTAKPLTHDGHKHPHGKFKARPPKTIAAKETSSFSLEGRKVIEASVKMRWDKGKLELFLNFPDQGDPKIYYKVGVKVKDKLHVYIPSASFGKISKIIFLVDEQPHSPYPLPRPDTPRSGTDTADASDKEDNSNDSDMSRTSSVGEIPAGLTPRSLEGNAKATDPNSSVASNSKNHDDEDESKGMTSDLSSYGGDFSSDEDDEPKIKLNIVIKPKDESANNNHNTIAPIIGIIPPTTNTLNAAANARNRRRTPAPSPQNSSLFPDFDGITLQPNGTPELLSPLAPSSIVTSPTSPSQSSLLSPSTSERRMSVAASPAERRLSFAASSSFSDDFDVRSSSDSSKGANSTNSSSNSVTISLDGSGTIPSTLSPALSPTPSPLFYSPSSSTSASPNVSTSSLNATPLSSPAPTAQPSKPRPKMVEKVAVGNNSETPRPSTPAHAPVLSPTTPKMLVTPSSPTMSRAPSLSPFGPSARPMSPGTNPPSFAPSHSTSNNSRPSSPLSPSKASPPTKTFANPPHSPQHQASPTRALSFHSSKTPPTQRSPLMTSLRVSGGIAPPAGGFGGGPGNTLQPELNARFPLQRRFSEPPPVDPNLLFPDIPKINEKKPLAQDVIESAKKYMQAAMTHLEKNSIPAALGNLDLCISLLGRAPESTNKELEYCLRYRMFLLLLKEISKESKPPIEHAFLSLILADIAVKPLHRIIAVRMAIRYNFEARNYGAAAALLQLLIERVHPVDENQLQERLRLCALANRTNADQRLVNYNCPACDTSSSIIRMQCSSCQHPVKICASSYEVITTKAYYTCKLCRLNFSRKSISPRDSDEFKCPFCKVGDLANKIFFM